MARLTEEDRDKLPARQFAFPGSRKEPIEDAGHVRAAVARFMQVKDVTDEERDAAWKRIQSAARKHGVDLQENDWRDLA